MCMENYVSAKILELCAKSGTSKYRLSQRTGISQSALSDITKMKKLPTIITLEKICDAFGITLAQFFTEDGEFLDLSEEQKRLLQMWATLKPEEKVFINTCMESLKRK
ncbi:MAG TPA: XRE family transcriptional regulator [Lachnospiraceae bacterium]|nr:XRE family transcriptional regulator [Lachnospiraceae bacterium]